jgi:hypothetical protein
MTLSVANCSCEGGTIERPGGGLFLDDVPGVFSPPSELPSPVLAPPSTLSPGFAVFWSRDSMMDLWWSRTDMLRCSCSLMVGSCVENPGERQAKPTSCMANGPSLAVNWPPEGRDDNS